jgi:Zn-dependent protease with chaperone function
MTATRISKGLTLAVAAVAWAVCAWLLTRTSVPGLDLSGLDQHRFFSDRALERGRDYSRGLQALWLGSTVATIVALVVLTRTMPKTVRGMALGRIGSAVIVGMVLLVTLWFVSLPFGLAGLWWQHHWGLGPFDVFAWLTAEWAVLGAEVLSVLVSIVLVVGLAGRFRRWWLIAGPVIIGITAIFAFTQGYLVGAASHPLPRQHESLSADARRLEQSEGVSGTPLGVEDVSSWTDQANAYTAGFGPSSQVILWDTLLDGRFTRGEERVVIAHELGHVKSRHIPKAIGWSALIVLPTLWLLALATRRRGGMGRAENVPYAVLVLTVLSLLTTPVQNEVSRRYEAEADWRALSATQDPQSATRLFRSFQQTSLEEPSPPLWDYLWLENHPTLMQRLAMAQRWREAKPPPKR